MLLAGCSTVCTTVAEAAKMWNLVVVSSRKVLTFFNSIVDSKVVTKQKPFISYIREADVE